MASRAEHSIQLNVRATTDGSSADLVKTIQDTPGVTWAEPLFPGESHPDLAKLYVVYLDESSVDETVLRLRDLPEIDYVDLPEPRKLIRPRKTETSTGSRSRRPAPR